MGVPSKLTTTFTQYDEEGQAVQKEFQIQHFEMLAIVIGLWNFRHLIGNRVSLWLRTDNTHVEYAIKNKNSPDEYLMSAVRWLVMFAGNHNLRLYVDYINTKDNTLADLASRFKIEPCGYCWNEPQCTNGCGFKEKARSQCHERGWKLQEQMTSIEIPNIQEW